MTLDVYPLISFAWLVPEMILVAVGCALLLIGHGRNGEHRGLLTGLTLFAVVAAILIDLSLRFGSGGQAGSGLDYGFFAQFVRISTLIVGVLIVLVSWSQPAAEETAEFFSMALFSLAGLMLLGAATDMVMLFLALELVSIPTYVMVTLSRFSPKALEAGTKYFYLGAMAAAITAYGLSFLYGVSGSASLAETVGPVYQALARPGTIEYGVAVAGIVLTIAGLLFKVAAFPLHFYVADVYQGAASPVAGLLGFVPKLAGFAALVKILHVAGWTSDGAGLFWLLWVIAALSMTIGNVLAIRQTNIKRMLGYSGIAHSGYMIVGLMAGPMATEGYLGDGVAAVLYYVVVYGIANLAAFAVLGALRVRGTACESLRDVAGLLRRQPGLALLMALAMFTLLGMPPTPGFWGKLSLFGSALAAGQSAGGDTQTWLTTLVIIGVINSAIGAAYYLRVIAAVLLYESDDPIEATQREAPRMGAALCGFLLLIFTVYPNSLLGAGRSATIELRGLARSAPAGPVVVQTAAPVISSP